MNNDDEYSEGLWGELQKFEERNLFLLVIIHINLIMFIINSNNDLYQAIALSALFLTCIVPSKPKKRSIGTKERWAKRKEWAKLRGKKPV